jgi:hypothetical protein
MLRSAVDTDLLAMDCGMFGGRICEILATAWGPELSLHASETTG